ncbi:hypothetical protein VQ056_12365 [Paenibacillus sp. JTLBN-2024]
MNPSMLPRRRKAWSMGLALLVLLGLIVLPLGEIFIQRIPGRGAAMVGPVPNVGGFRN